MTDPIRSFYRDHSPDLSQITCLSHRHFRILLPRGTFLKIPDRIRSTEILRTWLIRYRPSDVYYSTSCWLAPECLGRREGTPLSANIFLSSDIVFDIDRSPFTHKNLDAARNDTIRLLSFCDREGLPVRYIAFSGSKGFHVVCEDTERYDDPDPVKREDQARKRRKDILSRVLAEGIRVDPKITPDTRRIIRVPGTVNSRTGYVCTVINRQDLDRPVREILKYIPRVTLDTPLIPVTGNDSSLRGYRIINWLCHRFGVRSKPQSHVSYATFLVSSVPGIPLHIPVFVYPKHRNISRIESELVYIQQQYRLSDIYLYRSSDEISAVCLATFPIRRLEKILAASTASNYGTLARYHQLFFRIGERCDSEGTIVAKAPEHVRTLHADRKNNERFVSQPHFRFFENFLTLQRYNRMHGKGEVFITHTVIEDE